MVERGGLENRCTRERTVGSNPTLSAIMSRLPDVFSMASPNRTASCRTLPGRGDEWPRNRRPTVGQFAFIYRMGLNGKPAVNRSCIKRS